MAFQPHTMTSSSMWASPAFQSSPFAAQSQAAAGRTFHFQPSAPVSESTPSVQAITDQQQSTPFITIPSHASEYSTTNVYIHGLNASTSDDDLRQLCSPFGPITSAKAMIDKETGVCKGFGFVMFKTEASATAAVKGLQLRGIHCSFAKAAAKTPSHGTDRDPTNLYFSGLPAEVDEDMLCSMIYAALDTFPGQVVSCRILRNEEESCGAGLARLDSEEACTFVIRKLHNAPIAAGAIMKVKFANSHSTKKHSRCPPKSSRGRQGSFKGSSSSASSSFKHSRSSLSPSVTMAPTPNLRAFGAVHHDVYQQSHTQPSTAFGSPFGAPSFSSFSTALSPSPSRQTPHASPFRSTPQPQSHGATPLKFGTSATAFVREDSLPSFSRSASAPLFDEYQDAFQQTTPSRGLFDPPVPASPSTFTSPRSGSRLMNNWMSGIDSTPSSFMDTTPESVSAVTPSKQTNSRVRQLFADTSFQSSQDMF
eukprot:m.329674 g.329674  ORF g.329674 m.329674 type:complete len:479 (-) comp16039_c2_seq1:323-1759(-)